MPHIDKRTGDIVIRIVYDGAPEAGKTTNLAELVKLMPIQRRSQLVSPETTSRRTEFFDWVTFSGGHVDGRRLRCQLVSVPGQSSLLRRRRYLIDSADAVVFIADSRPEAVDRNKRSFDLMRRAVVRRGGEIPAGILLQANKQDLGNALEPAALADAMSVSSDVVMLSAVAIRGEGVMQTFVNAVRLGTARVKDLLTTASWAEMGGQESSSEELLAELQKLGQELDVSAKSLVGVESAAARAPIVMPLTGGLEAGHPERERPLVSVTVDTRAREPELPPLPRAGRVMTGHFWPLAEGRGTFAELLAGRRDFAPETSPWAPEGAVEVRVEVEGVVRGLMHTCDAWSFDEALPAKLALITLVRRLRLMEPFRPPGRALSLHDDGESLRIWMASDAVPTVRDALRRREPEAPGSDELVAGLRDAVRLSSRLGDTRVGGACLDCIGTVGGRAFMLAVPRDRGRRLSALVDELRALDAAHDVMRRVEATHE